MNTRLIRASKMNSKKVEGPLNFELRCCPVLGMLTPNSTETTLDKMHFLSFEIIFSKEQSRLALRRMQGNKRG